MEDLASAAELDTSPDLVLLAFLAILDTNPTTTRPFVCLVLKELTLPMVILASLVLPDPSRLMSEPLSVCLALLDTLPTLKELPALLALLDSLL